VDTLSTGQFRSSNRTSGGAVIRATRNPNPSLVLNDQEWQQFLTGIRNGDIGFPPEPNQARSLRGRSASSSRSRPRRSS
jgi:hypothetical protein